MQRLNIIFLVFAITKIHAEILVALRLRGSICIYVFAYVRLMNICGIHDAMSVNTIKAL